MKIQRFFSTHPTHAYIFMAKISKSDDGFVGWVEEYKLTLVTLVRRYDLQFKCIDGPTHHKDIGF